MYEMMSKAKIIVMVSHDLASIEKLCNRVVWMEHGAVREIGPTKTVIEAYTEAVQGANQRAA
jgi:ABC-type polysaccharide/polyol phosphate transport system ATPase subunit